jgi:hypothetical protein
MQVQPGMTALEIAGERRLRQLLLAVDLLAFGAISAVAFYLWRYWPNGGDVYSDLQRGASLAYLAIWAGIALLGALTAFARKTRAISIACNVLLLLECLAQLYFYTANHHFYHPWARAILDRFEPHPLLVGIPHPGKFGGLSHDEMHRRTTINENKAGDAKLIYVFGGSSTYDIGLLDSDTWPSDLSRQLGPHFEVQNYGVPGYTSLEAMIQSLFVFRDTRPVCAAYYEGWNDLFMAHVAGLASDYFPNQQLRLMDGLAIGARPGVITNDWLFLQIIDRAIQSGPGYGQSLGTLSDQPDATVSRIYTDNIKLIIAIDQYFGVKPIFVPQILNDSLLVAQDKAWWPYIQGKAVPAVMRALNLDLQHAAMESGAVFLDAPLKVDWQESDFLDQGHFSKQGAAKFAATIAPDLQRYCQ